MFTFLKHYLVYWYFWGNINVKLTQFLIYSITVGLYGMPADLCAKSYAVGVMTVSANRTSRWSLKEVHFVDDKPEMVIKVQRAFSDIFYNCWNITLKKWLKHMLKKDTGHIEKWRTHNLWEMPNKVFNINFCQFTFTMIIVVWL